MYMDDIKLFAKNEKALETLIQAVGIDSDNVGMEFGMEKMKKQKIANDGRNKTTKTRKN